jgi:hypothetical protein
LIKTETTKGQNGGIKQETNAKLMSHHEFIFGRRQGLEGDVVNVNSKKDFPTLG